MRTGIFAKRAGLSKETVYFYIEKGLLYPIREGSHYNFSEFDLELAEKIRVYQEMKFSLDEIIAIQALWNWSNQVEDSVKKEYLSKLKSKQKEMDKEINKLEHRRKLLIEEIQRFEENEIENSDYKKVGFPIDKSNLLVCPKCNKIFKIKNAEIDSKYIFNADLNCECGYSIKIKQGIVITGNTYNKRFDKPDVNRELYLNMPSSYYKSLNNIGVELLQRINNINLDNKILMETNINGFSFLYNNLKYIKGNPTVILIDKYAEVLLNYKRQLSKIMKDLNIIFIADDSLNYVLRKDTADIVISLFSGNEHQLYKTEDYFTHISRYIKEDGIIMGAFQSYDKNSDSIKNLRNKYPDSSPELYDEKFFRNSFLKYFENEVFSDIEKVDAYSNKHSFSCHKKGEMMKHTLFIGVKK